MPQLNYFTLVQIWLTYHFLIISIFNANLFLLIVTFFLIQKNPCFHLSTFNEFLNKFCSIFAAFPFEELFPIILFSIATVSLSLRIIKQVICVVSNLSALFKVLVTR